MLYDCASRTTKLAARLETDSKLTPLVAIVMQLLDEKHSCDICSSPKLIAKTAVLTSASSHKDYDRRYPGTGALMLALQDGTRLPYLDEDNTPRVANLGAGDLLFFESQVRHAGAAYCVPNTGKRCAGPCTGRRCAG